LRIKWDSQNLKANNWNLPLLLSEDDAGGGSEGRDIAGSGIVGAVAGVAAFVAELGENMRHPDFWAVLAN
jgi:hypothetical protein